LDALPGERFELIVSNPPYIAEDDPHLSALRHEPLSALTAGVDGLDDLRTLITQAPDHLNAGGWLLLEHGHDQASVVRALLTQVGFVCVNSRKDLAGIERCSGGQWPKAS
jgi:release factor glutamine methyltransferase